LAAPIAFDASLRRFCASCIRVATARRSLSSARIAADGETTPRRAMAASKAAGSSRIRRISCMGAGYAAKLRSAQPCAA
jgi:hypothetical protein